MARKYPGTLSLPHVAHIPRDSSSDVAAFELSIGSTSSASANTIPRPCDGQKLAYLATWHHLASGCQDRRSCWVKPGHLARYLPRSQRSTSIGRSTSVHLLLVVVKLIGDVHISMCVHLATGYVVRFVSEGGKSSEPSAARSAQRPTSSWADRPNGGDSRAGPGHPMVYYRQHIGL